MKKPILKKFECFFIYFSEEALQFLIDQINDLTLNVRAVFAGAETGVELADQLSEAMNLRTNGTAHSEERRNKFAMGEAVRNAGIRIHNLNCLRDMFILDFE